MAQNKLIDGKYEYFAFISYRDECEDAEIAKWLQNKLEHYKLPTFVRKENPKLPERISPIFEYKSETGNTPTVKEAIWKGLTSSKFLIVICSPCATRSKWINDGISYFVESGLEKNVIPFIIDGKPKAGNSEEECFPEELLKLKDDRELQGININVDGRDKATVKVISRMFDVKFDTLWQRYEREQRKLRRRKAGSILGAISIVAVAAMVFALIVSSKNEQLDKKNIQLENATNRLREDSITLAEHVSRMQNDSLKLAVQNDSILKQNKLIAQQSHDLVITNANLIIERNNVIQANEETKNQYARLVAQKAHELIEDNDYLTARKMLLEVLPQEKSTNRYPYVAEVEYELRRSVENNSGVIRTKVGTFSTTLVSPNGRYIVMSPSGGDIEVWNASNGQLSFKIPNADFSPSIIFFPTGELLVAGKEMVKLWDVKFQREICSYAGKGLNVKDVDTKGQVIAVKGQNIVIFDGFTGKNLFSLNYNNPKLVTSAAFLPNNKIVTSSLDDSIKIWDLERKEVVRRWKAHEYGVSFMHTNNAGNLIISGEFGQTTWDKGLISDDSLKVWNAETGELVNAYSIKKVKDAHLSMDNSKIIAVRGTEVLIINSDNGQILKTLSGHKDNLTKVEVSKNGKMIVTASNGQIRLWDENLNWTTEVPKNKGSIYTIPSVFYPDDSKFIIAAVDTFMIFDSNPVKMIKKYVDEYPVPINSLTFNKRGDKIVTTEGIAYIREPKTFSPLCKIRVFRPKYSELSPDDKKALTIQHDNRIFIWRVSFKEESIDKPIRKISVGTNKNKVNKAVYSPNGRCIASASTDGIIRIWDTRSYHCVDSLEGHKSAVNSVAYSEDGNFIVSASADKSVKIWDLKTMQCIKTLNGHTDEVCSAVFSKDSNIIISTSFDNTMRLWDFKTGKELKSFHSQGSSTAVSNDGHRFLVVNGKGSFKLYDYPSLQQIINDVKKQFDMQ